MTRIEIDTPKYATCDKVRQATGLQIQCDLHSKEASFKRKKKKKGLKPKIKQVDCLGAKKKIKIRDSSSEVAQLPQSQQR